MGDGSELHGLHQLHHVLGKPSGHPDSVSERLQGCGRLHPALCAGRHLQAIQWLDLGPRPGDQGNDANRKIMHGSGALVK